MLNNFSANSRGSITPTKSKSTESLEIRKLSLSSTRVIMNQSMDNRYHSSVPLTSEVRSFNTRTALATELSRLSQGDPGAGHYLPGPR